MAIRASILASTHRGLVRGDNQDRVAVGTWSSSGTMWRPWRASIEIDRPVLCLIADGMGGYSGGEVASDLAVRALNERSGQMAAPSDIDFALRDADLAIRERIEHEPALARMGTTVVGLLLRPDRLIWFNVGDSRLYQYRDGFLRQLSVDDVSGGGGSHGPRDSHAITQWIGGDARETRLNAHIGSDEPVLVSSRWLLCSDGLTDMLTREQMEEAMRNDDPEAWFGLFASTMEAGAEDNVSIMLITIEEDPGLERIDG